MTCMQDVGMRDAVCTKVATKRTYGTDVDVKNGARRVQDKGISKRKGDQKPF